MNTRFMKPSNYVHPSAFSRDFLVCFYHLMLVKFKKFIVKKQGAQKMNTMLLQNFFNLKWLSCLANCRRYCRRDMLSILYYVQVKLLSISKFYICVRPIDKFLNIYLHRKNHYRPCRIKYGLNS